jgi:hypothetical protein
MKLNRLSLYSMKVGESRQFCRKFDDYELNYTNKKDALKAWLRVNAEYIFGWPVSSTKPDDELHMVREPVAGEPITATITLAWIRRNPFDKQRNYFAHLTVSVSSGEEILLHGQHILVVPNQGADPFKPR